MTTTKKHKLIKNPLTRTIIRVINNGTTNVKDVMTATREDGIAHSQGYWGDTLILMHLSRMIAEGLIEGVEHGSEELRLKGEVIG